MDKQITQPLSTAIKDGQAHVNVFPHKDGEVELPSLDEGSKGAWEKQALGLESDNKELHDALEDIHLSILEAGWTQASDEQWVHLHVTPDLMDELEELLR